jgi:hypothetical protein
VVLPVAFLVPAVTARIGPPNDMDAGVHATLSVNEFLIVTQSDQRLVKLLIDADELLFWQRRAVPVGIRPELGDGADLGVARALNGQSDPDGFQEDAKLVQISDLLKVDRRKDRSRSVTRPLSASRSGVRLTLNRRASSTSFSRSLGLIS